MKKIFKKGFTLLELLVAMIIFSIVLISVTKIINEIALYKVRALNNYMNNATNIIIQNAINKIDIKDFIYGGLTYFPKWNYNSNQYNENIQSDINYSEDDNLAKHDLLYFVNRKYIKNNDILLKRIKTIVEELKIDMNLPFFVFSTSDQTIGIFWFEVYEDLLDPSDDIYNINLYYLDKNFYSKTHGFDKIVNLNSDSILKELIEDLRNHKTTLIKDLLVVKDKNEINSQYVEDTYDNKTKIKVWYDSPMRKWIREKDIIVYIEGGSQIIFSDRNDLQEWNINPELYPIIKRFYKTQQHTKYYLVGSFIYNYLGSKHAVWFNKIINSKTYKY